MAHLFLPGTGRPSLSAKFRASHSAGERVCSGVESQTAELLGADVLTSLLSQGSHSLPHKTMVRMK